MKKKINLLSKKHNTRLFIACIILSTQIVALTPNPSSIAAPKLKIHKTPPHHKPFALYAKAAFQHRVGDQDGTAETTRELKSHNPPAAAHDIDIYHLFETSQFGEVVKHTKTIKDHFKDNWELQLILGQAHLALNQDSAAEDVFSTLRKKLPNNEQAIYYSVLHCLKVNRPEEALKLLNDFLNKTDLRPKHALFYFLKSKILLSQNNSKEALVAVKKSIDLFPQFHQGWLMHAGLMEKNGNIKDAIESYQRFLGIVQSEPAVEKQLVALLFSQKRYKEAATTLRKLKTDEPEYYFDLGLIEWKDGNSTQALHEVSQSLKKNPRFEKARLLNAEILLSQKQYKAATKTIEEWVKLQPTNANALHTLVLLRKTKVPLPLIIDSMKRLAKAHPESKEIIGALADLHRESGDHKAALKVTAKLLHKKQFPSILSTQLTST